MTMPVVFVDISAQHNNICLDTSQYCEGTNTWRATDAESINLSVALEGLRTLPEHLSRSEGSARTTGPACLSHTSLLKELTANRLTLLTVIRSIACATRVWCVKVCVADWTSCRQGCSTLSILLLLHSLTCLKSLVELVSKNFSSLTGAF